jgi:hypothetical protein
MNEYIYQLISFIDQYLDNVKEISDNVNQYNCILCGRSKNNNPHMRVDYNNGYFYCYRCNEGGIIYNLLKELKSVNNKEYINMLLDQYFNFYSYDFSKKGNGIKLNVDYKYDTTNIFTNDSVVDGECEAYKFAGHRLGVSGNVLYNILKKYNIECTKNILSYNSFYSKFFYKYDIESNVHYKKSKSINYSIMNNDKLDYYYLINGYEFNNLYIAESLFDLMTVDITDILQNGRESNYLALCSKNYRKLFHFLLNTGKFYYDNIYLIIDNDINKSKFITNVINALSNNKKITKYKLYNNIYTIIPNKIFVDLNDQYINSNYELENVLISKIS